MTRIALAVLAIAALLGLAACGDGDDEAGSTETTATTTHPAGHEDTTAADTTQATETTETTETTTTQAEPAPRTIRITVVGGRPQGGIARPTIRKGEQVVLVVKADAGEYVHVHGYDLERAIVPGKPTRIAFTASIPGRFEVEVHDPSGVIADLEVRP